MDIENLIIGALLGSLFALVFFSFISVLTTSIKSSSTWLSTAIATYRVTLSAMLGLSLRC